MKRFYETEKEQLLYIWAHLETAERAVYGLSFDSNNKIREALAGARKAIGKAQCEIQDYLEDQA